jgi:hypothetical protein
MNCLTTFIYIEYLTILADTDVVGIGSYCFPFKVSLLSEIPGKHHNLLLMFVQKLQLLH